MILVINLGLKSIRAIIFDYNGRRVNSSFKAINTTLNGDKVEQDAVEWKNNFLKVVKEVINNSNSHNSIQHITVSCSASCLIPVDKKIEPVGKVIMVSDKRAKKQALTIQNLNEFKKINSKNHFKVSEYSQLSRILWIIENKPDQHKKTWKYLSPNDYLIALLCGDIICTDNLNAEKYFYDSDIKSYPNELFNCLGFSAEMLPECVEIGSDLGKIDKKISSTLGINSSPSIILGTYDAICSIFGTGVSNPGSVCDVSGTVTSVRVYSDKHVTDKNNRIASQYFKPCNGYFIGGSKNLGGGLIEWAKTCFYNGTYNPYEIMESDAALNDEVGSKYTGLIFLPNLLGARAPSWDSDARGVFFGIERHHSRGDLMRAIFESLAFSVRDFIEVFDELGVSPNLITASGGLSKIRIANEIKASVTGLPYHLMDEIESTSLGAAIIVMCSLKHFNSYNEACKKIIVTKQIFLPKADDKPYYDDMYNLYKDLTKVAKPQFKKQRELLKMHKKNSIEHVDNL